MGYGGIAKAIAPLLKSKGFDVQIFSSKEHDALENCNQVDLTNEEEVQYLLNQVECLPDFIINTCGVLHADKQLPEKGISQLNHTWLLHSIDLNVLTHLWLLKGITKKLTPKSKLVYCAFSARVSSISDNRLGGWYSYRMSKSMLNMLIQNVSLEWRLKAPKTNIFAYHPGTVETPLSLPFKSRVKPESLFSPKLAAEHFYTVLSQIKQCHNGLILDWQGKIISP
jgi:NAD(P)-dependent dehydrogenase (short-subunit alcohol dehydrogenase family)